ncbi:hypothetical protein FBU59_001462, partial [Linderina macrospora]
MRVISYTILYTVALLSQQAAHALLAETIDHLHKVYRYPTGTATKPGSYIVELHPEHDAPAVRAASAKARSLLKRSVDILDVGHHYDSVFKGFTVHGGEDLDPSQLARLPGVKRVWPVRRHKRAVAVSSTRNSVYASGSKHTGVERVVRELGLDGKGVKIAIVDSGVDYTHPELGGCWKTPGCPWQFGQDFIGDLHDENDAKPIVKPNPTPMDCHGHGTHVAGIIGGQGPRVTGIAPNATLGMYRVLDCHNGSSDDIILAGIEAAYKDGNDVISLSIGQQGWSEDPVSVLCESLVKKGVVVVVAASNSGDSGLFTSTSPAVANGVISVASVESWEYMGTRIEVDSKLGKKAITASVPSNDNHRFFFDKPVPLVLGATSKGSADGCSPIDRSLKGKVALIGSGTCTVDVKALNAQAAGAVGVVLVIPDSQALEAGKTNSTVKIPVVAVDTSSQEYLVASIKKGQVTIATSKRELVTAEDPSGGQISSFSSIGPTPELAVGPVVSAPGGNIYSTYPVINGGYATKSGTSMAAPYITGVVALFKQAHPDYSPDQIRRVLAATARPLSDKETHLKLHPYQSGSGLVDAYAAITADAQLSPSSLTLNDTDIGPLTNVPGVHLPGSLRWARRTVTIQNFDTKRPARVSLTHSAANSLTPWYANGTLAPPMRVWPVDAAKVDDKSKLPQVFAIDPQG